jgi:hypothetical protein
VRQGDVVVLPDRQDVAVTKIDVSVELLPKRLDPVRRVDDRDFRMLECKALVLAIIEDDQLFLAAIILLKKRVDGLLQAADPSIRATEARNLWQSSHRHRPEDQGTFNALWTCMSAAPKAEFSATISFKYWETVAWFSQINSVATLDPLITHVPPNR